MSNGVLSWLQSPRPGHPLQTSRPVVNPVGLWLRREEHSRGGSLPIPEEHIQGHDLEGSYSREPTAQAYAHRVLLHFRATLIPTSSDICQTRVTPEEKGLTEC